METKNFIVKDTQGNIIPNSNIWMIQFRNDDGPKIRVRLFGLGEDLWEDTCTIEINNNN